MLSTGGCNKASSFDPTTTKTIVVFYDRSKSTVVDRGVYAKAMAMVVAKLQPGDRLIMGPITGTSVRDFVTNIDFSLPPPLPPRNSMTDREFEFNKSAKARAHEDSLGFARLNADIATALAAPSNADTTAILETMNIAEDIFAAATNRKILIVLSDMLESAAYNFEKTDPTEAFIKKEIARLTASQQLPDLKGVEVYVVGAHADVPAKEAATERFWQAYFGATGAIVGPGQYARVMHTFRG